MGATETIRGRIESGKGEATFFTCLDWVKGQVESQAGFVPFPGTLNIRIHPDDVTRINYLLEQADFQIVPDDAHYCPAQCKRARIGGIAVLAVRPREDVLIHGVDVVEIVAPCHLKRTLKLVNGDEVTISLEVSEAKSQKGSGET